ncbi:MAG: type VI secretion system tip protein VgrG [Spirosomataceae bacterium]
MPNERLIPTPAPSDTPTFNILKADGQAIDGTYQLVSVVVTKQIGKISEAIILLRDGDVATEDFAISNKEDFLTGKELTVQAGYHGTNDTIFKGIIVKHSVSIRQSQSLLTLCLKHPAFKMATQRKNRLFADQKDSDIADELISKNGLTSQIDPTAVTHKQMVQYQCTDWDFLNLRAEANGHWVGLDNEKVNWKKPDLSPEAKIRIQYGATLKEFEAELDARHTFGAVESLAWEIGKQELITSEAAPSSIPELGNFSSEDAAKSLSQEKLSYTFPAALTDAELKAWADASLQRSRLAKIQGRAKCIGFADLNPGDVIELGGVGERFNGKAFVAGVRHEMGAGYWDTDVQFGLPDKGYHQWYSDISEPITDGLLAGINGLQIGVVTSLKDPDNQCRVQIKLPVISTSQEAVWARVATLDAGKNRGSFFLPDLGDEVIVGFINGDPRQAVLLGMLNSSNKPAPLTAEDANPQKGFVTRSALKWIFDDEKKVIQIETPAGNKITISEDQKMILITDQNSNKLEMTQAGILMESPKDITIKATAGVKIEGQTIEIKGSASAKLNGGGMTEIKGGMVQIN